MRGRGLESSGPSSGFHLPRLASLRAGRVDIRVLIVEDERRIAAYVKRGLEEHGYAVDAVHTGQDALYWARSTPYDLILLDILLPPPNGLVVCRQLRQQGSGVPILMLTARGTVDERVSGLDAGADDYLVKPFDLAELSARIGSVARRYSGNPNPFVTHGPLEVDLATRVLMREGQPLTLTAREWALFEAFLARPGQLLSKSQLEDKLYAFGAEVEPNTIEVHISRLRKKLGPGLIETERGLGYRLARA